MPKLTIDLELRGDQKYKQALEDLNRGNRVLASEMNKLKAEYKGNADSVDFLNKKGDLLQRQLLQQRDKVKELQNAVKWATNEYGEANEKTQEYIIKLNNAEAAEFRLEHAIEENNQALQSHGKKMAGLGDTVNDLANRLGVRLPQSATNALNGMSKLSAGTVAAMGAATAGVMALVKAVKSLQEQTLEAAAKADDIITKATQANISTQQYQAFQYASPFVDVDVESMTSSLSKLTKAMSDAQSGSEAAKDAFSSLNISIENADGSLRDAYDVWLDTMDALSEMANETERDAAAQELLGKSAATFAPIYREGTKALREYTKAAEENYAMSDEQLQKLSDVDDAWNKLQLSIEHNKDMIGAQWAPTAKEALETFDRFVTAAGKALIDSGIIDGFGSLLQLAMELLNPITELLERSTEAPGKLQPLKDAFHGIALVIAGAADALNWFLGLLQSATIVGAFLPIGGQTGLQRMGTAAGFGYSSGQASNVQKANMMFNGTWDQYASYYGYNAGGTQNWRGGFTWVGEAGPELVRLPKGSQIYNAQESREMSTTVNNYITVNGIAQLDEIINWYESRQVVARMKG